MQIWPFKPLSELTESLEWLTDVFRAKAGEQRFALRSAPRRTFNLQHLLDDIQYSAARAMVRDAASFYVPDWTQRGYPGAVSSGALVALTVDITAIDLVAGDRAILWESVDKFEKVTVDSITAPGLILTAVVGDYINPRLMPLVEAHALTGLTAARIGGQNNQSSIVMRVIENDDLSATTYAQYRGHDVLPSCPIIGSGSFNENIEWPIEGFDNQTSIPHYLRTRSIPDVVFQMRWHEFDEIGAYELRQWLHSRKGRQKAFWLSSYGRDLDLASTIGAASTNVNVFDLTGIANLGRTDPFDIEIVAGGVKYYRQVTSAGIGGVVDGRTTVDLTIDSVLGVEVASVDRISFLRCSRFNADRIELQHSAAAGVAVQVPCIEIPVP